LIAHWNQLSLDNLFSPDGVMGYRIFYNFRKVIRAHAPAITQGSYAGHELHRFSYSGED